MWSRNGMKSKKVSGDRKNRREKMRVGEGRERNGERKDENLRKSKNI